MFSGLLYWVFSPGENRLCILWEAVKSPIFFWIFIYFIDFVGIIWLHTIVDESQQILVIEVCYG